MSIEQQIRADLTAAMKARDADRVRALRMAVAAFGNAAVAADRTTRGALDDDDARRVLASEVKRRREAAEAFRRGGAEDRAAAEEQEAAVYREYLPADLGADELVAIVDAAVAEARAAGADGKAALGVVMKAAMAAVAGRADGARVAELVRERLDA